MTQSNADETGNVLRDVRRIVRALSLAGRDLARSHDLTVPQLLCLRVLRDAGLLTAGTLATALSLSPQTVTGLLDRLHARGLIERTRSETDRRQVLIRLSERGEQLLTTTIPSLQDRFVERFGALPAARRRTLADALAAIVNLLEAEALDAAPLLAPGHALSTSSSAIEPALEASLAARDTSPARSRTA
ncbi:MAG: MarR family winged helix-turn-helix transcriptional regulator [Gammaproteobacteria bacterium]